jgi:HK97 family phage portal protein
MVAGLFRGRQAPAALRGSQWSGTQYSDNFKRNRQPTPNELMAELKNTAWTCASINAASCANHPPSLYVITRHNQPRPKCATRPVSTKTLDRLHKRPYLEPWLKQAAITEEVTDHPLLDLFKSPNPFMGSFDLWELTTLYQEVHGAAYWFLDMQGVFGIPQAIWLLPTQNVQPKRAPDSPNIVDYYRYRTGRYEEDFDPSTIIHFRYPDPKDPYTGGLSPLRAAFEQQTIVSDYAAYKQAKFQNSAIPDAIVSPTEVMGEEERDRLETQWNQRFRRGGTGRILVSDSGLQVSLLNHSMGDVAALAEMGATKEDIANAFHTPIAFLTANTNMANLFASRFLHAITAIGPRLERRDERLNAQLIPLYDDTGRLFLDSGDPTPVDPSVMVAQGERDLKYGVRSINEVRADDGYPPVPWGEVPWLPLQWERTDMPRASEAQHTGRNRPPGPAPTGGGPDTNENVESNK